MKKLSMLVVLMMTLSVTHVMAQKLQIIKHESAQEPVILFIDESECNVQVTDVVRTDICEREDNSYVINYFGNEGHMTLIDEKGKRARKIQLLQFNMVSKKVLRSEQSSLTDYAQLAEQQFDREVELIYIDKSDQCVKSYYLVLSGFSFLDQNQIRLKVYSEGELILTSVQKKLWELIYKNF